MNAQNNNNWFAENPMLIHEASLREFKFGAWCALSAARIMGSFSLSHWDHKVKPRGYHILTPLSNVS